MFCCGQESQSDSIRVTLHSVDFNTSAPFRCEVSTDKPYFHTVIKSAKMTVISEYLHLFSILHTVAINKPSLPRYDAERSSNKNKNLPLSIITLI